MPEMTKAGVMAKRAAIYARFSTDLQADRSIDDQVDVCRTYAERNGMTVVSIFSDRALSGSSVYQRHGMQDLLTAARDRRFDVMIAETMSRVGRDEEDRAAIRKRLTFAGISIMTPVDGVVTRLTDGIKAVIDSQYIEDLKVMIRRGLSGVVRDGRSAGGRAYGYRPVPGKPGELAIVEEEAEIVRRIFSDFVAGRTPRDIAVALNRNGIRPPRGARWNASAIGGSASRASGILRNSIYAGRIVWNKVRMVRDPDTGRRVSRVNPRDEWQSVEVPGIAIISDDLFAAAERRLKERGRMRPEYQRRPKHLLSGLLCCGVCGAGMSVNGVDRSGRIRIRCTAKAESGTCPDARTFYLDTVERAVLDGLKSELTTPDMIAEYVRTYHDERKRLAGESHRERMKIDRRLPQIERELTRAVDAIVKGIGDAAAMGAKTKQLAAEREELTSRRASLAEPAEVTTLHPAVLARYRGQVGHLQETLGACGATGDGEAAQALRELVSAVIVRSTAKRGGVEVEVAGRLSPLLGERAYPNGIRRVWGTMVAEEGFEPPTHGL
jgi:DNA invertase Pin-like site-specific DNA recombinase